MAVGVAQSQANSGADISASRIGSAAYEIERAVVIRARLLHAPETRSVWVAEQIGNCQQSVCQVWNQFGVLRHLGRNALNGVGYLIGQSGAGAGRFRELLGKRQNERVDDGPQLIHVLCFPNAHDTPAVP